MVGPTDYDREAALKKGFSNENLIAVDESRACIKAVRAAGNLAIQGRIEDLIAIWSENWPISAIIADFTCGLDHQMIAFQGALMISLPGFLSGIEMANKLDPNWGVLGVPELSTWVKNIFVVIYKRATGGSNN